MSAAAWTFIGTAFVCIFGSGGIVLWFLNRYAEKQDKLLEKQDKMLEKRIAKLEQGIKLGLENDAVIFKALRENKINGESEAQEEKMDKYFRDQFI